MYCRHKKRPPRKHRPRPENRPEDVIPVAEPAPPSALYTITLHNPRSGRDCVITPFDGGRPGRLRTMVNGVHNPKLGTQTKLMTWLREKLPRTSPKRAIPE